MTEHSDTLEKIVAGKITSVYGTKGWVKVYSYTDPKENIFKYGPYWLETESDSRRLEPVEVDQWRVHGQGLVAHIKDVDDRDEARIYCQREIFVGRGVLPQLEPGEYYWHQLTGLKVYSNFQGEEKLLGAIKRMMETGANDVMVVQPIDGSIDQRERLLPYLPDRYQTEVNLEVGCLTMDWDPDF